MIDTHCHLTYPGLIERASEVIAAANDAGVHRMISVGTSPADARKALELAEQYACVYVAAGLHPHHAPAPAPGSDSMLMELRELLAHPKVVALGEMGLDWHYPDPSREHQRAAFASQLTLMDHFRGPGVIHNREATDDTLAIIREAGIAGDRFVFHCFTGKRDELDAILDLGAMVSFTGIVTFKNAADLAEASDHVPLDRLMIETDSPYLTPIPHRKVKINEPRYVVHVAEFLAGRRNMSVPDFTAAVDANAVRFFSLE